jgi:hypothetical protein
MIYVEGPLPPMRRLAPGTVSARGVRAVAAHGSFNTLGYMKAGLPGVDAVLGGDHNDVRRLDCGCTVGPRQPRRRAGRTDYEVYDRRPSDSDLLIGAVEAHQARLGRTPRLVAADAAFYSAKNEVVVKAV